MNQVDDHWMRPRTKAGTEEMRKRLNAMRELLAAAAKTQTIESKIASKVFDEYFSFDWDDEGMDKKFENIQTEKKKVALPDRC
jgi:hypothetical protein